MIESLAPIDVEPTTGPAPRPRLEADGLPLVPTAYCGTAFTLPRMGEKERRR